MVIIKDPRLVPVRQYQQERVTAEWTAFLVAWGDQPAGVAAQLVVDAIPGCEIERVEVPEGIWPADQYLLTIRSLSALPLDALVPPVASGRKAVVVAAGLSLVTSDNLMVVF